MNVLVDLGTWIDPNEGQNMKNMFFSINFLDSGLLQLWLNNLINWNREKYVKEHNFCKDIKNDPFCQANIQNIVQLCEQNVLWLTFVFNLYIYRLPSQL